MHFLRSFLSAAVLTAAFSPSAVDAASASYMLKLSVPVICKGNVERDATDSGTFVELCNILEPYQVALRHESFEPSRTLAIEYDGTRIALDPDGYTVLKTHGRGGRTLRPFRIPGAGEGFMASLRIEATPSHLD